MIKKETSQNLGRRTKDTIFGDVYEAKIILLK